MYELKVFLFFLLGLDYFKGITYNIFLSEVVGVNNYQDGNIYHFEKEQVANSNLPNLFIPKDDPITYREICSGLVCIEHIYYYAKEISFRQLINELIGSYLAKVIDLDTVDYKIGMCGDKLFALSKILFEEDYRYFKCPAYFQTTNFLQMTNLQSIMSLFYFNISTILKMTKNTPLYLDALKLTALDLKMGQTDRHYNNLFLQLSKDYVLSLAKVFDYEKSYFNDSFLIYENPFVSLRNNRISLKSFANQYPQIRDFAWILTQVPIEDVLADIGKQNHIFFSQEFIDHYMKSDKKYTKILKKLNDD